MPDAVIDDVVASQPGRIERWRARIEGPEPRSGALVAELDGRVVGSAFWGPARDGDPTNDLAEVYAIYLDPDALGRGIGRSLFAATVDAVVASGFSSAVLWVLESNGRARRFYEAAGWRPDGTTKTEERPGGALHELRYARTFAPRPASAA